MNLRPYQQDAFDAIIKAFTDTSSALVVKPTGTGKTILFAALADHYRDNSLGRVLVFAHRAQLVRQACDKIEAVTGIRPSVEMGSSRADGGGLWHYKTPFVVATYQSLVSSRGDEKRMHGFDPKDFALVVIDEAHRSTSKAYREIVAHFRTNPDCKILGVTATPDRADRVGLGTVFQTCAYQYQIKDAIADGWLVPIKQATVPITGLDLSYVKTAKGDFTDESLGKTLEEEKTALGIAGAILQRFEGRTTIVFCPTVRAAEVLTAILNRPSHRELNCPPEHLAELGDTRCIHGGTSQAERNVILDEYHRRRFKILVNVDVATEGFDEPEIGCVVIARPTKSRGRYAQMIGRGTRTLAEAKVDDFQEPGLRRQAIASSRKPDTIILDIEGETATMSLVHAADVLGDSESPEVRERAKKIAREREGESRDVEIDLEEAKRLLEAERLAHIEKNKRVAGKVTTGAVWRDPTQQFCDMFKGDGLGQWAADPPTEKQVAALRRCGLPVEPGLTKGKASRMLGENAMRREKNLAPLWAVYELDKFGVNARQWRHQHAMTELFRLRKQSKGQAV